MPYEINKTKELVEVRLSGKTTERELLEIIGRLQAEDPRKTLCDMWVLAPETLVPATSYPEIAQTIEYICSADLEGARSAIVAANELQKAQVELYTIEAADLPFEIRVFRSEDEARAWLKETCSEPGAMDGGKVEGSP